MNKRIASRLLNVAKKLGALTKKAEVSESVLESYLSTALWSTQGFDEEGNDTGPLDDDYGTTDFNEKALKEARNDLENFFEMAEGLLDDGDDEKAAHDFWLTRNGHGAGFGDGDWEHGDELTKISKTFGSVDIYVGDDNELYFT